jgi:hypothetical protein
VKGPGFENCALIWSAPPPIRETKNLKGRRTPKKTTRDLELGGGRFPRLFTQSRSGWDSKKPSSRVPCTLDLNDPPTPVGEILHFHALSATITVFNQENK